MGRRGTDWVAWAKVLVWTGALIPLAVLLWDATHGGLDAEPVKDIQHRTGKTALVLLLITLSNTPIRRLTGAGALIRFRRLTGLFAFFYATLHFTSYLLFDLQFAFGDLAEDVLKRPWITIGFTVFLILLTLAITSPRSMVRRLGSRRWNRLHRLIYLAAIGTVVHFYLSVKKDVSVPLQFAGLLLLVLGARLAVAMQDRRKRALRSSPDVT
jgi:sulfoxide reductase heme-binding subunit YedZ